MFPAIVLMQAEIDLYKRTPLRPLRLADQVHSRFLRGPIRLERIAFDAGANNIFPGCGAAAIARDDVIEIQIVAVEGLAAILARVLIALKNVVPCEFDLFLGQVVIDHEQYDSRHTNPKRHGSDRFRMWLLLGKIVPLGEIISLERAIASIQHNLGVALKKQCQRPSCRTYIDRLPKAIQHQHVLAKHGTHNQIPLAKKYTNRQ